MPFRVLTAAAIFMGSYLPLGMILLAQDYDYELRSLPFCLAIWESSCSLPLKNSAFSLSFFCFCAACFLLTIFILTLVRPKHEIDLLEAKYVPSDLMNHTLPYVVSFMSINYQDTSKSVGLVIFIVWMFWITYKSGHVLLNPLLIVLGWRLYDLKYRFPTDPTRTQFSGRALSKQPIAAGESHRQVALADILLIKP